MYDSVVQQCGYEAMEMEFQYLGYEVSLLPSPFHKCQPRKAHNNYVQQGVSAPKYRFFIGKTLRTLVPPQTHLPLPRGAERLNGDCRQLRA